MRIENGFDRTDLKVDYKSSSALKPYAHNPRTHSKKQIRQIANSIKEFGFTNPILVDGEMGVIAGHGRLEAAKQLGVDQVPTIKLEDMSDDQKRAYILADNKLAENAGWDREILAIEFQHLIDADIGFDIEVTGFEMAEIDLTIESAAGDTSDGPADDVPDLETVEPPVCEPGDLWLLGRHRLLCADATKLASYEELLSGERAQMVFSDPPYNVPIDRHVCGLGSIRHAEFAMASGEMSKTEFTAFLSTVLGHMVAFSADGTIHFICMDWRHMDELIAAGREVYSELKNLCVWAKTNGGMGSLYRSQHELVFVFKNGTGPHINNVELGRHGRYRTNLWTYAGANTLKHDRLDELSMHPTVKPVALVRDAILDCSKRNGIVLDAFSGSGTTIIAAEKTGRIACGLEIDPRYVDVAIKRWTALTGEQAIHSSSGLSFELLS